MVCTLLKGRRQAKVPERRTAVDCAHLRREVGDEPYPPAETLVLNHLTTHQLASVYKAFTPTEAQ